MSDYDPNYVPTYALFLLSVKAIVYDESGRILLLKRSDKTSRAHGWDLAGGGVDKNESPDAAVKREIFEETGLTVDTIQILAVTHGNTKDHEYVMLGYVAQSTGGNITLSWEHESYQWMTADEVRQLDLPPFYREIFEAFEKQSLSDQLLV